MTLRLTMTHHMWSLCISWCFFDSFPYVYISCCALPVFLFLLAFGPNQTLQLKDHVNPTTVQFGRHGMRVWSQRSFWLTDSLRVHAGSCRCNLFRCKVRRYEWIPWAVGILCSLKDDLRKMTDRCNACSPNTGQWARLFTDSRVNLPPGLSDVLPNSKR